MILIVEGPYEVRWGNRVIQKIVIWTAARCRETDIDCFVKLPFVPEFNDSGDDCRALSRSNQAPWAIAVIAGHFAPSTVKIVAAKTPIPITKCLLFVSAMDSLDRSLCSGCTLRM